ncbi:cyanophycin synthetase [Aliiruegeria sabulilitoris]|uniref:cyanophycin synthetase n=1 Tax=Aliiruegeria sabulilitoris TaxID=1510458 RepID=UPI0012E39EE3|nr:cyanophycin synthetase [Aliiruegeria sabulilitoris]NDR57325.1 cyanophycin synthetase [Pseudoruegeria sp. M32A2M]
MLSLSRPDSKLMARTAPFVRMLSEAAEALGISLEMDDEYGFVGRIVDRKGRRHPIFGKSIGLNADAAAHIAADKDYTARWLAADTLPTPAGRIVFSPAYQNRMALRNADTAARLPGPEAAAEFAEAQGWPVIVKPNTGSEGRDIRLCTDREHLLSDLRLAFASDDVLRVERRVPGRDYRLLVLDGRVLLAYERVPLSVKGDGSTPLAQLVDVVLAELRARHRGAKISADDPRLRLRLAADGRSLDTILRQGESQRLLDNANLSTGGTLRDWTGNMPAEAEALAIRAADSLGLRLAGVDILAPALEKGMEGATILEVNSAPGLDYFATATPENWPRARSIVTEMLRLRIGEN